MVGCEPLLHHHKQCKPSRHPSPSVLLSQYDAIESAERDSAPLRKFNLWRLNSCVIQLTSQTAPPPDNGEDGDGQRTIRKAEHDCGEHGRALKVFDEMSTLVKIPKLYHHILATAWGVLLLYKFVSVPDWYITYIDGV